MAQIFRTKRDVTMFYPDRATAGPMAQEITIPAGTEVIRIEGNPMGPNFAVKSERLLVDLTGNTHDPKYRHAYVPDDAVDVDRSEPTWENQLWHARKLADEKGLEALNNPHAMIGRQCGCGTCFCCAALHVYNERTGKPSARR